MRRIEPWQTYQRLWSLAMLPGDYAIQFQCGPLGYNEAYFVGGASNHASLWFEDYCGTVGLLEQPKCHLSV